MGTGSGLFCALHWCMLIKLWLVGTTCALAVSCTGMTSGENRPGADTWVDPPTDDLGDPDDPSAPSISHTIGALAVEPDETHVWFVHRGRNRELVREHLAALDPVTNEVHSVLDVSGATDRRLIFPRDDRMLLMAQHNGQERLVLFDTDTRQAIKWTTKPTWYWGTRRSASGEFLAVADNGSSASPLHVIDANTLEHIVVPHGGTAIEAMWNNTSDHLLAVSATNPFSDNSTIRLLSWNVTSVQEFPAPSVDITLPGYDWDFLFSFTWIGVSPDGRWAVFPLRDPEGQYVLVVLDQNDGSTRMVPGQGPVGFTPDSSSIVSYGYENGNELYMIDVVTLQTDQVPVAVNGGLSFFVTWDGNYVVATSVGGDDKLVIYDPETGESTQVEGPHVGLREFVARPGAHQLWLADLGQLYKLHLEQATLTHIPLGSSVRSLNILPTQDRLVHTAGTEGVIRLFDMATEQSDGVIALTPPYADELARTLSAPDGQ